jgi:PAS domain-containing protein
MGKVRKPRTLRRRKSTAVDSNWRNTSRPNRPVSDAELLEAIWEALNVARDNKALVMVCGGRIVNINQMASDLCGASLRSLEGKCVTKLLGFLPSAAVRVETVLRREGNEPIPIEVTRQYLSGVFADVEIFAIRDLRERQATAEQLRHQGELLLEQADHLKAQNQLLEAALSNMVQGLAMFDAEQRVVVANAQFAEMYGQSPADVVVGTPLRKIIERRIASGLYVGTTAESLTG